MGGRSSAKTAKLNRLAELNLRLKQARLDQNDKKAKKLEEEIASLAKRRV